MVRIGNDATTQTGGDPKVAARCHVIYVRVARSLCHFVRTTENTNDEFGAPCPDEKFSRASRPAGTASRK
jgi:hypothetical protein